MLCVRLQKSARQELFECCVGAVFTAAGSPVILQNAGPSLRQLSGKPLRGIGERNRGIRRNELQKILKLREKAFDFQILAQRWEIFIDCSHLAVRNHSRVQTFLKFSDLLVES